MEPILKIENLTKNYGAIYAINNLSLTVNRGDIFGILGPNGSGKTTTLSIILGIIKQDTGNFTWFNKANILDNKKIGALVEQPNFYPYLSLVDNLNIVAEIKQVSNIEKEINRVLELVSLHERQLSKFNTLSLGMKQRLALAALLLGDPEILILDEPTNGLDPKGIVEVREIIISEAEKGKTIIIASHILSEIEKVCSHVAILQKGKLIKQAKVDEILKIEDTIIISSDDIDVLYEAIARSGMFQKLDKIENEIHIILNNDYFPKDINKFAFENGFILSKFEVKKKSLEEQFLKIIK